jgi:hypothetical protein
VVVDRWPQGPFKSEPNRRDYRGGRDQVADAQELRAAVRSKGRFDLAVSCATTSRLLKVKSAEWPEETFARPARPRETLTETRSQVMGRRRVVTKDWRKMASNEGDRHQIERRVRRHCAASALETSSRR